MTDWSSRRHVLLGAGLLAFLLVLPLAGIGEYWIYVLTIGFYYAVLASSWSLLVGYVGRISFAHVAMSGLGAYTSVLAGFYFGLPVLLSIPLAGVVTGVVGLAIGRLCLRLHGAYLGLTTIAFSEILRITLTAEHEVTRGSLGMPAVGLFETTDRLPYYYSFLALLLVSLLVMWLVLRSRIGLFFAAIREDEDAAASLGVKVVRWKIFAFTFSSVLAGIAGQFLCPFRATRHTLHAVAPGDGFRVVNGRGRGLSQHLLCRTRRHLPRGSARSPARNRRVAHDPFRGPGRDHLALCPQRLRRRNRALDQSLRDPEMTAQLQAHEIVKRFGGLVALYDVSIAIDSGEIVGLIGPNGSGKTTLLNLLSGFYKPDSGDIRFEGQVVNKLEPHQLALKGLTRTFQVTKIFHRLTVLENLLVPGMTDWGTSHDHASARGREILDLLELTHIIDNKGSALSGGQSKLLEFGRIMMLSPKVVLLGRTLWRGSSDTEGSDDQDYRGLEPARRDGLADLPRHGFNFWPLQAGSCAPQRGTHSRWAHRGGPRGPRGG